MGGLYVETPLVSVVRKGLDVFLHGAERAVDSCGVGVKIYLDVYCHLLYF